MGAEKGKRQQSRRKMPPAIKLPKNLEKKKELLFKLYKDATGSTKSAKYKEIIKLRVRKRITTSGGKPRMR